MKFLFKMLLLRIRSGRYFYVLKIGNFYNKNGEQSAVLKFGSLCCDKINEDMEGHGSIKMEAMNPLVFDMLSEDKMNALRKAADVDVMDKNIIENVKKWFSRQPPYYLPESLFDDETIVNYILLTGKVEIAKEKILNGFLLKIEQPDWFMPCDPLDGTLETKFMPQCMAIFPKLTPEGSRIHFLRPFSDSNEFPSEHFSLTLSMMNSVVAKYYSPVMNYIVIIDLEGMTMKHGASITSLVVNALNRLHKTLPSRISAVVYVNAYPFMRTLINLVTTMMKDKIKNRVHVYSEGVECILKHVPKEVLPTDLGGVDFTLKEALEQWCDIFKQNRDFFLNERNILLKYANLKAANSSNNTNGGVQGVFKTLDID